MPKHFLYVMDPHANAPAGDGDMESWFRFYKWKVEGETFVPRRKNFFKDIGPGDYVWFGFEGFAERDLRVCVKVLGGARVTRVEDENRTQEIWYQGDDVFELEPPVEYDDFVAEVPVEVGEAWLMKDLRSRA